MARLYTAEACAHAIAGDASSCSTALRNADRALTRAGDQPGPVWAGYFTRAHLAGTAVRCWRDLGRPKEALRYAEDALTLGESSVRTRTLHTALVASVHTSSDRLDLDQACVLGDQALAHAGEIRSRRVNDRITDLARRLRPHRSAPLVADFIERAELLVQAA